MIHFVPGKKQNMEQVKNGQTIYSATIYCRLSKNDEQAGESVSIETQKMMLTDFCHERGFLIYEIYAYDGYSGLNFNRPACTRLLEDIDSGKVNLVIAKDLSRLCRDYIQTGYYTDSPAAPPETIVLGEETNIVLSASDCRVLKIWGAE